MFSELKTKIKEMAQVAVSVAEETLGSNKGKEKKQMAITYIVSRIPVIPPLQKLIAIILSKVIDEAVEFAVQYMKTGGEDGRNEQLSDL